MTVDASQTDSGAQGAAPEAQLPLPFRWATWLAEAVGAAGLIALMGLTVSDALLRSFLNRPILGSGDLVQVILVVVVACAVPLCIAAGRAIAIEMLVARLPDKARTAVQRATGLIGAAVLLYLAWRCYVNAGEAAMFGESTMLLRIPYGPYYAVLAVSFLLSALLFMLDVWRGRILR